jgi:glycosyltransferase involved in cell wall biosynthesis
MLAEVKKQLPNVLLIIAGEGPAEKHLHALTRSLGLENNVKFIGYLDRETELKDCYCAGNAFVFASRTETQGLVLLEAMALGVPVVSTAVMGTRDILEEEMGAIIAEEDKHDFATKVINVLQDNDLRQLLSTEAMVYAKRWSEDRFAHTMIDFYYSTVEHYIRQSTPEAVTGEVVD